MKWITGILLWHYYVRPITVLDVALKSSAINPIWDRANLTRLLCFQLLTRFMEIISCHFSSFKMPALLHKMSIAPKASAAFWKAAERVYRSHLTLQESLYNYADLSHPPLYETNKPNLAVVGSKSFCAFLLSLVLSFFRPHWPCSTLPFHWMWIFSRNQMPLAWLKTKCPQILETSFHLVNICRLEHILRNHSAFDQFHVFWQLFTSGWARDPFTLAFPAVSPFSVPPPFTMFFQVCVLYLWTPHPIQHCSSGTGLGLLHTLYSGL